MQPSRGAAPRTRSPRLAGAVGFAALMVLAPRGVGGDALVVTQAMKASTIAEISIEADRIRLELEIGADDLPAFRTLHPTLRLFGPWCRTAEARAARRDAAARGRVGMRTTKVPLWLRRSDR